MTAAEGLDIASLAFPVLGAGSGGMDEAVALQVMETTLEDLESDLAVTVVRFRPGR